MTRDSLTKLSFRKRDLKFLESFSIFFTLKPRPKSASSTLGASQDGQAKAKFNFQAQTSKELSLIKG